MHKFLMRVTYFWFVISIFFFAKNTSIVLHSLSSPFQACVLISEIFNLDKISNWYFEVTLCLTGTLELDIWLAESGI